jgi:hypothetical protein
MPRVTRHMSVTIAESQSVVAAATARSRRVRRIITSASAV